MMSGSGGPMMSGSGGPMMGGSGGMGMGAMGGGGTGLIPPDKKELVVEARMLWITAVQWWGKSWAGLMDSEVIPGKLVLGDWQPPAGAGGGMGGMMGSGGPMMGGSGMPMMGGAMMGLGERGK